METTCSYLEKDVESGMTVEKSLKKEYLFAGLFGSENVAQGCGLGSWTLFLDLDVTIGIDPALAFRLTSHCDEDCD
ncbi:hypothetical protein CGRA01v4_06424 [Colletotrichum graminicola]|nr:hypothetical protein CGRA01v4_06424 [Colletotrichum graminicola]